MLDHVTRWCQFKEPAKVTNANGISTKLYGPWLKAKSKEFLHFLSPSTMDGDHRDEEKHTQEASHVFGERRKAFVLSYEGSLAIELHKNDFSQIVVPIEDSNDVLRQANLIVEELKALMNGET